MVNKLIECHKLFPQYEIDYSPETHTFMILFNKQVQCTFRFEPNRRQKNILFLERENITNNWSRDLTEFVDVIDELLHYKVIKINYMKENPIRETLAILDSQFKEVITKINKGEYMENYVNENDLKRLKVNSAREDGYPTVECIIGKEKEDPTMEVIQKQLNFLKRHLLELGSFATLKQSKYYGESSSDYCKEMEDSPVVNNIFSMISDCEDIVKFVTTVLNRL